MDDNQKELKSRLKEKYGLGKGEDPYAEDHLVAARYHTANEERIIDIPCLSWSHSAEDSSIEIYDGDFVHIVPLSGIISITLPKRLQDHYYRKFNQKTKKMEWVKSP